MHPDNSKSVAILGCGWLGTGLAKSLLSQGFQVLGTRQTEQGVAELAAEGITAKQLTLSSNSDGLHQHDAFDYQTLVICFPPKLKQGQQDYPDKVAGVVRAAEKSGVKRLVLVSTTGVYNGLSGTVTEESELDVSAAKVAILRRAEQALASFSGEKSILRLAGLVGPLRHPGRFFNSQRRLSGPNAKINLIHQADAVGLLQALLQEKAVMGVYNGVSNTSGTKSSFYQAAAKSLGQAAPKFKPETKEDTGRQVSGQKAREVLGYNFIQDDLNDWLTSTE